MGSNTAAQAARQTSEREQERATAPRRAAPLAGLPAAARDMLRRVGGWNLALFFGSLALFWLAGNALIAGLPLNGDEPWYVMLGYAIAHNHTVSLTAIVNDPPVYHQFLYHWDDHTKDYLGNGERLLPNMPGYSALIGPLYLLAGRSGIVALQAVVAALTVVLLFGEGRRLFGSRAAGIFASAAFALALPALAYISQAFPSAIASFAAFAVFPLATRILPTSQGWRQVAAALGTGALIALLPWLHFKYALLALALLALALWRLAPRLRRAASGVREASAWRAAGVVCGTVALGFALIALYSHRYFGTWTPQYSPAEGSAMDFAHPNLPRVLSLYGDMFLSNQSGLFPWVPLDLLVIPGLVLLWRRDARQGQAILVCLAGQLGGFLPALFTGAIYQGYALPSRFTVESAPYFALCATGVFAASLPGLRAGWRWAVARLRGAGRATSAAVGWRAPVRALPALGCIALLLSGGWFIQVGLRDPNLLYHSRAGNRLVLKYPGQLPAWWFGLFPDPEGDVAYRYTVQLTPDDSNAIAARQGIQVRSASGSEEIPPGRFTATFVFACAPAASEAPVELVVERFVGGKRVRIADQLIPGSRCATAGQPVRVPLAFPSDGYHRTGFRVLYPPAAGVADAQVSYAPQGK